jgi:hypothetical protein
MPTNTPATLTGSAATVTGRNLGLYCQPELADDPGVQESPGPAQAAAWKTHTSRGPGGRALPGPLGRKKEERHDDRSRHSSRDAAVS